MYLGKLAAVLLPFVEMERKDSGKDIIDGIGCYDLYKHCQNISNALGWDL